MCDQSIIKVISFVPSVALNACVIFYDYCTVMFNVKVANASASRIFAFCR